MAATKSGKKHPKAKKGIRNDARPNGKAWKKGLPPEKREQKKREQ